MSNSQEPVISSYMLKRPGRGSAPSLASTWTPPTARKRKTGIANQAPSAKRVQSVSIAANVGRDEDAEIALVAINASAGAKTPTDLALVKAKPVSTKPRPKNPEACLVALPTELLDGILEYLSRKSLSCLSRVSRKMHEVAALCLYGEGINRAMGERRRRKLTNTICRNPYLANMVKNIEAEYVIRNLDWSTFRKPAIVQRKDGAQWTGEEQANMTLRRIEDEIDISGRDARLLDMALNAATKVQSLVIRDKSRYPTIWHEKHDFWWVELLVNAAIDKPVGPTKRFESLKTLNISLGIHISGWLRLERLSPILRLESLEDATFSGLVESERIANWGCPEDGSKIKKLALENSFLHSDVVAQLLSSCKALTHCAYAYSSTNNFEPYGDQYGCKSQWAEHSWAVIGEQLQRHKATLQALNLFYDTDRDVLRSVDEAGYDTEPKDLGSLGDFAQLKLLAAPIDALLPHDAEPSHLPKYLPKGLESLDIRVDALTRLEPARFGAAIESLATNRSGSVLRTLHVSVGDDIKVDDLQLLGSVSTLSTVGLKALVTQHRMHRLGHPVKEIHGDMLDQAEFSDSYDEEMADGFDDESGDDFDDDESEVDDD
ncbi:hypothetical protein K458DRAFT_488396 [Lentithecium fluviatile CBS 122367]|uniref:F-box domain-containing protein n=1 Tax=Lentithecium fluviatile CBS 122367 TaxID=1168545 RepID=A0A6G1IXB6_9PLEO|nr:hypothetical protein K458DRAFT_488396 [Lentithecium fluviatile CBS 122367]